MQNERKLVKCSVTPIRRPARLQRNFVVRWQDEDSGWHSVTLVAASEEDARSIVAATVPGGTISNVYPMA